MRMEGGDERRGGEGMKVRMTCGKGKEERWARGKGGERGGCNGADMQNHIW